MRILAVASVGLQGRFFSLAGVRIGTSPAARWDSGRVRRSSDCSGCSIAIFSTVFKLDAVYIRRILSRYERGDFVCGRNKLKL